MSFRWFGMLLSERGMSLSWLGMSLRWFGMLLSELGILLSEEYQKFNNIFYICIVNIKNRWDRSKSQ